MITHLRLTNYTVPTPHRLPRRRRSTPSTVFSGTIFRLRPRLEVMEDRTLLSTFLVSNTGDSGPGSLRQAILDSNSINAIGATNTIDFDISGTGVQTIIPLSSLPAITNAVLIDGTSQPGYSSTPLIEINGRQAGSGDGLTITGAGVTVRGLDIDSFSQGAGIHLTGTGATGDWIYGNFLGTDPTGTQAEPNYAGVEIDAGAASNLIGTNGDGINDAAEQNLISGNLLAGVWINGQGTDVNAVAGNFIGTSVTGDVVLDNGTVSFSYDNYSAFIGGGVVIEGGAYANRIGTDGSGVDDAGQRNVISGSGSYGVDIVGAGTDDNIVAGNFIGTDLTGTIPLGIASAGVNIADGASANRVGVNPQGGAAVGDEGNVISGSVYDGGVRIYESDNNVVAGDKIGTDATGEIVLRNSGAGVEIDSSSSNTIGGTVPARLTSSRAMLRESRSTRETTMLSPGTRSGQMPREQSHWATRDGVEIDSSSGNTIGGTSTGAADVISGNGSSGVELDGSSDNLVEGDFIGTDASGTQALGNGYSGVIIQNSATDNTIGGTSAIAGNLISKNDGPGVVVVPICTTNPPAIKSPPTGSSATRDRPSTSAMTG